MNCINAASTTLKLRALSRCFHGVVGILLLTTAEVLEMRYILAWALGVPFSVIVLWYIVAHAGC